MPDQGFGEDAEAELVAEDVGISGCAAAAEEAAVDIIEDDQFSDGATYEVLTERYANGHQRQ